MNRIQLYSCQLFFVIIKNAGCLFTILNCYLINQNMPALLPLIPIIQIDSGEARELDQIIAKQTPTINIDPQKAHNLDRHLVLQKLYYRPEGLYQNVKGLWDACKKAGYSFPFIYVKKWLEDQA